MTRSPRGVWRRSRNADEGFALIAALVFLFVILMLGSNMIAQAVQELSTAGRAKKETLAFNLAEAGIDYGAWKLYNWGGSGLPKTWSKSDLAGGSFTVTAENWNGSATTILLTSTGTAQGWTSEVKVVGKFLTNGVDDQNAVFDHALFSNSDMTISGNYTVTGDAHANGNVTIKGSPLVDGDLSAMGTVKNQGSPTITGTISQNQPRISMPAIDLAYYRAKASTILTGDQSFTGTTDLNGITFVDGDATINGSFRGQGVIVVAGSVMINGNATLTQASDEFAVIAARGMRINGNCRIEGWLYAHSVDIPATFEGSGNAEVIGGIAADVIKCNGSLNVTYNEVTVEMPGATVAPAQFDAVSWRRVR